MPIYMDRHIVPGITLADAAEAHNLDVAIQDDYNCTAMTFWLDEERGCAFCLIEAPHKQAVRDLHDNAHGLIPHEIMEVEEDLVMAFLGRMHDPESGTDPAEAAAIFCEPAYRAILITQLVDSLFENLKHEKGKEQIYFSTYSAIVEEAINKYSGCVVRHTRDGFMISFASINKSVHCAVEIQQRIKAFNRDARGAEMQVAMGLSAGVPVTGNDDLFGEAVQLAERLCYLSANREKIVVASAIKAKLGSNRFGILSEKNLIKSLNAREEDFLSRLMDIIEKSWNRDELSVTEVCRQVGLSRSQLYRNITSLTGRSFADFIRAFRLQKALKLIEKHPDNITRVAYETGFNNPSYFAKCFKQQYDILPSEYAQAVS